LHIGRRRRRGGVLPLTGEGGASPQRDKEKDLSMSYERKREETARASRSKVAVVEKGVSLIVEEKWCSCITPRQKGGKKKKKKKPQPPLA